MDRFLVKNKDNTKITQAYEIEHPCLIADIKGMFAEEFS